MIQTILVLKRSGENICSTTYGDTKWNETLTSGFISAAFNFTEKTFGSEIDDIELGPFKVLFEVNRWKGRLGLEIASSRIRKFIVKFNK